MKRFITQIICLFVIIQSGSASDFINFFQRNTSHQEQADCQLSLKKSSILWINSVGHDKVKIGVPNGVFTIGVGNISDYQCEASQKCNATFNHAMIWEGIIRDVIEPDNFNRKKFELMASAMNDIHKLDKLAHPTETEVSLFLEAACKWSEANDIPCTSISFQSSETFPSFFSRWF